MKAIKMLFFNGVYFINVNLVLCLLKINLWRHLPKVIIMILAGK